MKFCFYKMTLETCHTVTLTPLTTTDGKTRQSRQIDQKMYPLLVKIM